jgi:hypothetical protein
MIIFHHICLKNCYKKVCVMIFDNVMN